MGTLVKIKLYANDSAAASDGFRRAFARITKIDQSLSDYRPDSELNRICRTAIRCERPVSVDLFNVLARAQELAEETDGAFDVTIGPVTHLWREARKTHRIPDESAIQEARAHSGYRKLHLGPAQRTVRLDEPGMQLDVGAIGKGYAADQALAVLNETGIASALVAASGDLAFSDAPPGKRGWKIGVDGIEPLILKNAAVSTSGDAEQFLEKDGKRYSHVVDARTGSGLMNRLSVTIVAPRGIDADGADTAIDALGPHAGMKLVERHQNWAAILVLRNEEPPRVLMSTRFRVLTASSNR